MDFMKESLSFVFSPLSDGLNLIAQSFLIYFLIPVFVIACILFFLRIRGRTFGFLINATIAICFIIFLNQEFDFFRLSNIKLDT